MKHYAKIISYPCGVQDIIACSDPIFCGSGWEEAENYGFALRELAPARDRKEDHSETDLLRSMRRARSQLRKIALANNFRFFVTLTLDSMKVDRYDPAVIVKKLNAWCSNMVQRKGLRYILVPERHKDGAIHFHGFFNDVLPMEDSGTVKLASGGKPRRPRSSKERARWLAAGGQVVYNLPGWSLGYTTALELYGEYPAAVAYVCKYIGKDGEKIAGRWYYSGGDLKGPKVEFAELSIEELKDHFGGKCLEFAVPGRKIAVVNPCYSPHFLSSLYHTPSSKNHFLQFFRQYHSTFHKIFSLP
ncbi:MAG: hypothetical protein IKB61_00390 [Elusimicrobiaceae bacterium]|nr:hypothetical protein [Elusimicrobiaceae bacterium]